MRIEQQHTSSNVAEKVNFDLSCLFNKFYNSYVYLVLCLLKEGRRKEIVSAAPSGLCSLELSRYKSAMQESLLCYFKKSFVDSPMGSELAASPIRNGRQTLTY